MDFSKLTKPQMDIAEMVIEAATTHGVDPNLLLAQAFRESSFSHIPSADPTSDAFGVMQIRPSTAEQNKLGDITDLRTNIFGGAKLMRQYLDQYKSPEAALLAYHQGPGVADSYVKSNGDLKSVGKKGLDYVIAIGENGGFGVAPQGEKTDGETPAEKAPSIYGEVQPLPPAPAPAIDKRPNLKDMPDWYKNLSPKIRNREGDISAGTVGTAGAGLGVGASFFGNKGLEAMEKGVTDAKAAYQAAQAAAQGAVGASADTAQKLGAEVQRLEAEYRASLAGYQTLERELAESVAESKRYLPPETDVRGKVAGESGTKTYARVMPGQLPPEAMLAEVEDQTRGKNPRGKGAWDIADQNAANIQKQKDMGLGGYKMTGTGSEQFVLGPEETARRQAQMDAAGQRAKQLSPLAQTAQGEAEAARQARETADRIRQREVASAQKAAREAQTAQSVAQTGVQAATEAAPRGLGKVGALAQKIPFGNLLAGAGMGMSAAEALNRYEKGDTSGAVLSGVQVVLDGMAMLPPGTPVTAFLKGIGVVGGLATTAYDIYRTQQMDAAEKAKNPPLKARGGLTLMR